MDFITHSLIGANTAKLLARGQGELPTMSLAAVLASLLMDGDSWLALLGPAMYGRWHRVASHSIPGLLVCAGVSAGIAVLVWRFRPARRFGWFVSDNLPPDAEVSSVPFRRLIALCTACAFLHAAGDLITGFGNMKLAWPLAEVDFSLHAVTSFDWPIFCGTLIWHVASRRVPAGSSVLRPMGGAWVAIVALYVAARLAFGAPTVW